MLRASGDLCALQVSLAGTPVAVLHHRKRHFALHGQDYTIESKSWFRWHYELLMQNVPLASARKNIVYDVYTVSAAGKEWMLNSLHDVLGKRYDLYDGRTRVGGITPASRLNYMKDISIDLPEELQLATQVFLMWVVLHGWGQPGD